MESIRKYYHILLIIILALNILGAILVLFTPFGGMIVATAYGPRERFASLGSGYSEFLDNVFIVLIAICLVVTAFLSFLALLTLRSGNNNVVRPARIVSIITFLLAIIGAISFEIIRAEIDYLDWWLDTGFYAAIVVGLVNSIFYLFLFKKA
jgi:hypothetical protein